MDESPNREAPAERGAVGSDVAPQRASDPLQVHSDDLDAQVYYSDDERDQESADDLDSGIHLVHHYHHQHCPNTPCGTPHTSTAPQSTSEQPVTADELSRALEQAQRDIRALQNERLRLQHRVRELSVSLEESLRQVEHTFGEVDRAFRRLDPACFRPSASARSRRGRTPSPAGQSNRGPDRERYDFGWEPIDIISTSPRRRRPGRSNSSAGQRRLPVSSTRRHFSPTTDQSQPSHIYTEPTHTRTPPRCHPPPTQANSVTPSTPPATQDGEIRDRQAPSSAQSPPRTLLGALAALDPVPPATSPSRLRARLLAEYPQFTAGIRRNTRRFFFFELLQIRERFPEVSVDSGWSRLVARLAQIGFYPSAEEVARAWMIAFGEAPHAHFRSLFEQDVDSLRAHLPNSWRVVPGNLIRF